MTRVPSAFACLFFQLSNILLVVSDKEYKTYVTVFNQNYYNKTSNLYLYISSSRPHPVNCQVVSCYLNEGGPFASLTLSPGQRERITLPYDLQMPLGTLTSNRTVTVIADDDVTVMVWNYIGGNGDMFQVREVSQLGKEYVIVSPEPFTESSASTVGVISPFNDVNVKVTLPASILLLQADIDGEYRNISGEFTFTLNQNTSFQIQSESDLSGTLIQSDLPIAVISGVNRTTDIYENCLDGQSAQLSSVDHLGTRYIVFGFLESVTQDFVHIVSTEPNTVVTFQGNTTTLDQARDLVRYRIDRGTFSLIESSAPISVAVSSASGRSDIRIGDVSFYNIQPLPLRALSYTVTFPSHWDYMHLVIVAQNDSLDDILLDDVEISDAVWYDVEGTDIVGCYYNVTKNDESITLRHRRGKPFAAYLQAYQRCVAYTITWEPNEKDIIQHTPFEDIETRRDLSMHTGTRMTSLRMKFLLVDDINQCFLHCLAYEECTGVNFSGLPNPGEANCQLVFTQTNGQDNIPNWTFYELAQSP